MVPSRLQARFEPGENIPGFAVTTVIAGHAVKVVADKTTSGDYSVGHAGAGEAALGFAEATSADSTGTFAQPSHAILRRINIVRRGAIARAVSGAAIPLLSGGSTPLMSDATGRVVPHTGSNKIIAYAMHPVSAADAVVEVDVL